MKKKKKHIYITKILDVIKKIKGRLTLGVIISIIGVGSAIIFYYSGVKRDLPSIRMDIRKFSIFNQYKEDKGSFFPIIRIRVLFTNIGKTQTTMKEATVRLKYTKLKTLFMSRPVAFGESQVDRDLIKEKPFFVDIQAGQSKTLSLVFTLEPGFDKNNLSDYQSIILGDPDLLTIIESLKIWVSDGQNKWHSSEDLIKTLKKSNSEALRIVDKPARINYNTGMCWVYIDRAIITGEILDITSSDFRTSFFQNFVESGKHEEFPLSLRYDKQNKKIVR